MDGLGTSRETLPRAKKSAPQKLALSDFREGAAVKQVQEYIAGQRKRCGIYLSELGRQSGISHTALSNHERGLQLPNVRTFLAILSSIGAGRRVIADVRVIGRRIRQLRLAHLLSQPEFSYVIGNSRLSAHRVGDWESGRIVPSMASLVRICRTFAIGLEFFFGLTVRPL